MKTIHVILREDFGALDPNVVRTELLATAGVHNVAHKAARNELAIEYDPDVLTPPKLFELLCTCGLYPDPRAHPH